MCVCAWFHTACVVCAPASVRITNSSVLYDMLQNDLKFISNKSFWLCDGFFCCCFSCSLPNSSSCFTSFYLSFYSFGRYMLHMYWEDTHVCVRTYYFNVSQFWIVQYTRFVPVNVFPYSILLTHSLCNLNEQIEMKRSNPLKIVNASEFVTIN